MSTPARLGLFAVALAAVFGLALGAGAAVGPIGPAADEPAPARTGDHGPGHD